MYQFIGLIRAKVLGVREATGDVVAFMDSHCEVNDGWLEPLLDRLVRNPKAVVCPVIDAIDADTFQVKEAIVEMGAFTWGLNFYWLSPPHTKHDKEVKTVIPFKSPAMAGGAFQRACICCICFVHLQDNVAAGGGGMRNIVCKLQHVVLLIAR